MPRSNVAVMWGCETGGGRLKAPVPSALCCRQLQASSAVEASTGHLHLLQHWPVKLRGGVWGFRQPICKAWCIDMRPSLKCILVLYCQTWCSMVVTRRMLLSPTVSPLS